MSVTGDNYRVVVRFDFGEEVRDGMEPKFIHMCGAQGKVAAPRAGWMCGCEPWTQVWTASPDNIARVDASLLTLNMMCNYDRTNDNHRYSQCSTID